MPFYDYKCEKCGCVFEAEHRASDKPLTTCRSNGCRGHVRRVFAPPALVFKGKGFHSNDYGKQGSRKPATPCEKSSSCPSGSTCPAASSD